VQLHKWFGYLLTMIFDCLQDFWRNVSGNFWQYSDQDISLIAMLITQTLAP
jgi:hypothetical protein